MFTVTNHFRYRRVSLIISSCHVTPFPEVSLRRTSSSEDTSLKNTIFGFPQVQGQPISILLVLHNTLLRTPSFTFTLSNTLTWVTFGVYIR